METLAVIGGIGWGLFTLVGIYCLCLRSENRLMREKDTAAWNAALKLKKTLDDRIDVVGNGSGWKPRLHVVDGE